MIFSFQELKLEHCLEHQFQSITKSKFDFLVSPTADGAVKIGFATTEYAASIIKGESDASKFGAQVFSAIKGIISGAKAGFIKQLFAGVFGAGEATNIQKINLQMNTQIKLNGTLSDDFAVVTPSFAWPGYNQNNTAGYAPSYNEPLGVFYISAKPKIKVTKVRTSGGFGGGFGTTYWHYPIIDLNSFQLEFNPAVVGGNGYVQIASIQNIKREIILLNPGSIPILEHNGQIEAILNSTQNIIANPTYFKLPSNVGLNNMAIRISFDVVPTNGSEKIRIAKTFIADVVY